MFLFREGIQAPKLRRMQLIGFHMTFFKRRMQIDTADDDKEHYLIIMMLMMMLMMVMMRMMLRMIMVIIQ